jgi:hypothetical protein
VGGNGNVAPQQAGGGKDGSTGRVQAPVAPGSTPLAAGDMPSSEEVEQMKWQVADEAGRRDGTWAAEEPCTGRGGPAVDSKPQAALEAVLADSQDEEEQQGAPKSIAPGKLVVLPASKRRESVPAAPLVLAEGTLVQRETQHSTKKGSLHKEAALSLPQRVKAMVPSSAPNRSFSKYFLLNRPL